MADPIVLFVDEAYLQPFTIAGRKARGVIQACIPVRLSAVAAVEGVVRELVDGHIPPGTKALKGSKMFKGNQSAFRELLKCVGNYSELAIRECGIGPLVTLEGSEPHEGKVAELYRMGVDAVVSRYSMKPSESLLRELIRQLQWLERVVAPIPDDLLTEGVSLVLDNKYRHVVDVAAEALLTAPNDLPMAGIQLSHTWGDFLQILGSSILKVAKPQGRVIRLRSIDFVGDEGSIIVQACDLLAHLTLNALRFEKGIRTPNTEMKWNRNRSRGRSERALMKGFSGACRPC